MRKASLKRGKVDLVATRVRSAQQRALQQLCKGLSIAAACRAGSVSRKSFYKWVNEDPDFKQAVEDAIEEGSDELEDVATKRAKRKSDVLLMFLLNGRRPEKYKRKVEHSGDPNQPIIIAPQLRGDENLARQIELHPNRQAE
jgi:hypothetical protein